MDARDAVLQLTCPTVMVPRFGSLEPMTGSGHRFLAAADGLWLEVQRPWLHLLQPLARQVKVAMPYGSLTPFVQMSCGPIPKDLVVLFVEYAHTRMPNECAAWITWSEMRGFRLRLLDEIKASRATVVVERPVLEEGEHLVVDLHSHGTFPAGFSTTDNTDDRGEVKIAGVVGSLDATPGFAFRVCALGLFIPFLVFDENGDGDHE